MSISDTAFTKIKNLVYETTGIHLADTKKQMVSSRLTRRLRLVDAKNYDEYYNVVKNSSDELQMMIDIITTNETSFFRESAHFDFVRNEVAPKFSGLNFRAWSAAASIGAEAYTLGMVLDEVFTPKNITYEIIGTDINTDVIIKAKRGVYPMDFANKIEPKLLKKYCLKGFGSQEGVFMMNDYMRSKCQFLNANLMNKASYNIGKFDVIFLRNMLIYFDERNKKIIVENVLQSLKSGGYLFIGHSESLNNITKTVKLIKPTIYQKL